LRINGLDPLIHIQLTWHIWSTWDVLHQPGCSQELLWWLQTLEEHIHELQISERECEICFVQPLSPTDPRRKKRIWKELTMPASIQIMRLERTKNYFDIFYFFFTMICQPYLYAQILSFAIKMCVYIVKHILVSYKNIIMCLVCVCACVCMCVHPFVWSHEFNSKCKKSAKTLKQYFI
jgi:hypothetical protein